MYKTKLISVRVDEDSLSVLENATRRYAYPRRSDAINAAIRLMAAAIEKGYLNQILRYDPHFFEMDSLEIKFRKRQ